MTGRGRLAIIGAAVVIAVLAFVLLQPDDEESSDASAPAATTREETPAPAPAPETTRIRVTGGQPVGGVEEIEVQKDETVRLSVSADAPEHVHVHGYNLFKDVGPGQPARFRFKADIEGVFEIELEDSAVQIAELKVEP